MNGEQWWTLSLLQKIIVMVPTLTDCKVIKRFWKSFDQLILLMEHYMAKIHAEPKASS